MSMIEIWWLWEAKRPRKMYGSMTEEEVDDHYWAVKEKAEELGQ